MSKKNNMPTLESLQTEINEIKARNARVEADKKWETSSARKLVILGLTYLCMSLFFYVAKLGNPLVNAIVPSLGFFLSTLAVPFAKKWWLKKFNK